MSTKPPSRILAATDFERLVTLWQAAGLHYKPHGRDTRQAFEQQLQGGTQVAIGVEGEDGALIGAVLATHDGRKGWINRLAVHPDHRRQGLATQLVTAAEEVLRGKGLQIFAALIEPDNEASLAMFVEAGYVEWPGLHYVSKRDNEDV